MIWQSIWLMSAVDLSIMAIGIYVGLKIYKNNKFNPQLKGKPHRLLIGAGLFVIAAFFAADLFTMWILPRYTGMESAMASMEYLHLNISWFVNPLAICLIAAGFLASESELTRHQGNLEQLIQDRTEELRHAVEDANKANRVKTEFLASVSHELRTPLHGVMSFAELGRNRYERLSSEKILQYFENIYASGSRLLHLVENLLDISKLSVGKMSLEYSAVDINEIWQQATLELKSLIDEKNIRLEHHVHTDMTICECDRHRILQVLSNILSNAIKFSPYDSVIECEVNSHQLEYEDVEPIDGISVAVSDQGEGISANDLESIFEKFTQAGNSSNSTKGTGLGLAICREIVNLHGGRVQAENRSDTGARIAFSIPRARILPELA